MTIEFFCYCSLASLPVVLPKWLCICAGSYGYELSRENDSALRLDIDHGFVSCDLISNKKLLYNHVI